MSEWFQRSFSDGSKPSLSRQLLAFLTVCVGITLLAAKPLPETVGIIYIALGGWAGFSRHTSCKHDQESLDG